MPADAPTVSTTTPGLLVSVTNVDEAVIAAELGVDIVDIKNPQRGALGAADPEVWRAVAATVDPAVRLSAALGEAIEADHADQVPARFDFAKAGPAGCSTIADLTDHWQRIRSQLAASVPLVAVAYADYQQANCPLPEAILEAASANDIHWWLIDTFVKDGRSTLDHLTRDRLRDLNALAGRTNIRWVLAGSLRLENNPLERDCDPHYVGLRGDVCQHGRTGTLVASRVKRWQQYLRELK
ncbi:(5-formylfuran-3-yl)methyl phosphate synthase [Roseimaritima ulvae]|uniref:(5-formylfuran-3-yl)methyl phosphate synthase n=1 Tax=Roseimaritima ulvae TaxID=980254 RepID=A0A5B9QH20_9BACT|nr:(5-formylfuran-3-yl)methyl phosphate synthase [Roseimaritima ulvae]QEG38407.1 hypothetical protein UC8_03640 [Roseimaritima ulvae]